MAGGPLPPFHIDCSGEALAQLRAWEPLATELGMRNEYLACMREIHARLSDDPTGWGNPLKDFPDLKMILYHGATRLLYVRYGVNEEARLVYIQLFKLTPGSPMDRPPASDDSPDS